MIDQRSDCLTMRSSDEDCLSRSSTPPASLMAPISPPLSTERLTSISTQRIENGQVNFHGIPAPKLPSPNAASIEAGKTQIRDHLEYFSTHLRNAIKPGRPLPAMSIDDLKDLYRRNCHLNSRGRHFVVHQHDHPVAGLHYDLRLQISETSSVSFAIMYGLPGNPNSRRLNRNATETRVHNLWVCSSLIYSSFFPPYFRFFSPSLILLQCIKDIPRKLHH